MSGVREAADTVRASLLNPTLIYSSNATAALDVLVAAAERAETAERVVAVTEDRAADLIRLHSEELAARVTLEAALDEIEGYYGDSTIAGRIARAALAAAGGAADAKEEDVECDGGLAEMAWVIIANVSEGDWTKQPQDWQDAAAKWRDDYHASLRAGGAADSTEDEDAWVFTTEKVVDRHALCCAECRRRAADNSEETG